MSFYKLNLIKPLIVSLEKKGYLHPTPIQQESIPVILDGKDVFGCAQTGTGKTAAFALPVLQQLYTKKLNGHRSKNIKALILAPTRELAIQINESIKNYGNGLGLSHTLVFGGVSQHIQTAILGKGVDILVATPGRLVDLMNP